MESSVRTRQIDSTTYRIALAGEIDMYTSPEFSDDLRSCIQRGASEVIVDLSAATFIDSTFLGSLIGGVKLIRERGGEINVVCPDPMRRTFELTGLDHVLPIAQAPVAAAEPAT